MRIVVAGFGVFLAIMATGIAGARIVGVEFDGGGFAALFVISVLAGACSAIAQAGVDEGRGGRDR